METTQECKLVAITIFRKICVKAHVGKPILSHNLNTNKQQH